jgi:predicted Fe-Mo cluster-binding NifX family protein
LLAETDDMSFETFDNENVALGGGAGIQSAQFIASKGAKAVLTGNCGPNAVRTLSAAGVELFVGQGGTVREAIEKYKNGALTSTNAPNVPDHHGLGSGSSAGEKQGFLSGSESRIQQRGMGRGMGMGGGRGAGRGMGMGRGMAWAAEEVWGGEREAGSHEVAFHEDSHSRMGE